MTEIIIALQALRHTGVLRHLKKCLFFIWQWRRYREG